MSNIKISYGKIYTDDTGKTLPDIGGLFTNKFHRSIKTLWVNVIEGFMKHNKTVSILCISGNIRIVIMINDDDEHTKRFEEYYLSGMDGKFIDIPSNTKYAIQNIDENKSIYLFGFLEKPETSYSNKNIFNWRKKQS